VNTVSSVLRSILRSIRRVVLWWVATFRARGAKGKVLFGIGSLVALCFACSIPLAALTGPPAPTPDALALVDSLAPVEPADDEPAEPEPAQLVPKRTAGKTAAEPPTDAPAPTDTAEPTDTPAPTNTATTAPTRTTRPTTTSAPTNTAAPAPANAVVAAVIPDGQQALVTRIIDGDTIDVSIDGQIYRVRYIGMDTPERGMPFFSEATEANRQLVGGQTVILVKDVSETDRYNRLLRYVYLANGVFVNAELVRQGFAQIATYPPDVAHQAEFLALQQQAREAGLGLWAQPAVQAAPPTWTPAPLPTWTLAPPPTWTPVPQPVVQPPPPADEPPPTSEPAPVAVCDCSGDIYNCSSFATQSAAQACFNYCWTTVGRDVHRLDGDGDGIACENNP
jgi:micrococcal nuclease